MVGRVAALNIISPDAEDLFSGVAEPISNLQHANSLADLRVVLERQCNGSTSPVTLDLIGHSTRDHHLLRLGRDPIDMLNPFVARFFSSLAAEQVLSRLVVVAVRLLGCETAVSSSGQRTLRLLSRTLRLPVFGARRSLMKSHYDKLGFNPVFNHILVEASALGQPDSLRRVVSRQRESGASHTRGDGEKLRAILPMDTWSINQPQICFINQR